jgi:hypothetical protein
MVKITIITQNTTQVLITYIIANDIMMVCSSGSQPEGALPLGWRDNISGGRA